MLHYCRFKHLSTANIGGFLTVESGTGPGGACTRIGPTAIPHSFLVVGPSHSIPAILPVDESFVTLVPAILLMEEPFVTIIPGQGGGDETPRAFLEAVAHNMGQKHLIQVSLFK